MYEKPRVNVKVEPRSTFTFTRDLPLYFAEKELNFKIKMAQITLAKIENIAFFAVSMPTIPLSE